MNFENIGRLLYFIGVLFIKAKADGWQPADTQLREDVPWHQNQQNSFGPDDSQVKDSGRWNNNNNQGWSPGDAQSKDGWNNNDQMMMWGSQMKVDGMWDNKNNNGGQGNWNPNDAQVKDQGRWDGGQDRFGPGDSQVKDQNWMGGGGTGFGPGDSQRKDGGNWNQQQTGGWGPMDSQVKNPAADGGNWTPGDGQVKTDGPWSEGVTPSMGWDQGGVPETTGGPWEGGQGWTGDAPGGAVEPPTVVPDVGGGGTGYEEPPSVDVNVDVPNQSGDRGDMGGDSQDLFPPRQPQGNYKGGDSSGAHPGDDPSQWRLEDSIPGTPGVDYPNYSTIPATSFDCKQHENPGYYGDVEAQCQVFHICQSDGRHDSFLCPLGTIFNQQYFVCVWWFNYNCDDTMMFYNLNADLYKGGHGGQGNFKGTPALPETTTGTRLSPTEPGRSDYENSIPGGPQEENIIPPGVGEQPVGSSGEGGLGVPEDVGGGFDRGQDGYPQIRPDVESERPQGPFEEPMVGIQEPNVPAGQDGYGQGQDGGKINRGGQRDWNRGVKGGVSGGGGGRWDSQGKTGVDGGYGKKGGSWGGVKGRKARSWDNGDKWETDSEYPLDREGSSWVSLDEEPVIILNPKSVIGSYQLAKRDGVWRKEQPERSRRKEDSVGGRDGTWERVYARNDTWRKGSGESTRDGEREKDSIEEPERYSKSSLETDVGKSREAERWRKRNEVIDPSKWSGIQGESVHHKRGRTNRNWDLLDKSLEESPKSHKKNWWLEALKRSKDEGRWGEDKNKSNDGEKNNAREGKDAPHIYGGRSSLSGYLDYSSEEGSDTTETRNWT